MKTTATNYETLIVLFAEPIRTLEESIFDDPEAWGVASLKEWIDSYESSRFTQTDERMAEWLERNTSIDCLVSA